MKKLFVLFAALAAMAAIVAGSALANVTVDSTGHGSVGKGDVQNALGLKNDAAMTDWLKTNTVKFGYTGAHTIDYAWTCPDGNAYTAHFEYPYVGSLDNTPVVNNGKTVSWNLTGQAGWPSYTGSSFTGTPPLTCDGQYDQYTSVQRMGEVADTITGLTVNGKPLAITPVAL